jgi:hypothetical protein
VLNFKVESKNHANSELKASIVSYQDKLYFTAGIFFLAMAKAKNIIKGYSTPKPFGKAEINRCIDYDIQVVEKGKTFLNSGRERIWALGSIFFQKAVCAIMHAM